MWTCEKCGRTFQHEDQDHYCGEPPKTVDAYIKGQSAEIQPILNQVRETLRSALVDATEKIAWSMPTYWEKHNIIHFAAFKKHIGLYPGPAAIVHFSDRLTGFKTSKGAIQFPYDKPVPLDLIAQIAIWCRETGNHH